MTYNVFGGTLNLAQFSSVQMDLYLIFQFIKGHCHGNQIMLP